MITVWVKRTSNQFQTSEVKTLRVFNIKVLNWEVIVNHLPADNVTKGVV